MTLVCADLATKAELNELKAQLNTLLGQKIQGGEINVLEQGNFTDTVIGERLELANTAIQEIEIGDSNLASVGTFTSPMLVPLGAGALQVIVQKGASLKVPVKAFSQLLKIKGAAVLKNIGIGKITMAGAGLTGLTASSVVSLLLIVASLIQSIANLKVLGSRIDASEKLAMSIGNDFTGIYNMAANLQKGIAENEKLVQENNIKIAENNLNIAENNKNIANTKKEIADAEEKIAKNNADAKQMEQKFLKFKAEVEAYEGEVTEEFENVKDAISQLEANLEISELNYENLLEITKGLGEEVADLEARNFELADEFKKLQWQSTFQAAELQQLKKEVSDNKIISKSKLNALAAKLVLLEHNFESLEEGTEGFPYLPMPVVEQIADTQKKTLTLANSLSSNPASDSELDIAPGTVLGDNDFSSTFDKIMTGINIGTLGLENMNVDDLAKQISTTITGDISTTIDGKLGNLGLPDVGIKLDKIAKNTDPIKTTKQIEKATETAICRSTKGQGCMIQNIGNPINNGQKNIADSIKGLLDFLEKLKELLDQETLEIVKDTNKKINQEFQNAIIEKTILAATYANTLHNAAMLSTGLNQSVMITGSGIWDDLKLKDYEGQDIDPQNWVKGRLDEVEMSENNNQETLNSQNKLFKINPVTPEWWALRPGSERPQLVIIFKPKSKDYKPQTSRWSLTIPRVSKKMKPQGILKSIPDLDKGSYQGTLILTDNSKLIVYAKSPQAARSFIESIISKGIIDSDFIPKNYFIKIGNISKQYNELKVTPEMAKFFSTGQKNLNPDWIAFSNT